MITQNELIEALEYRPDSGIFLWRKDNKFNGVKGGTMAGLLHLHGYIRITINRKAYQAHRLAWLYVHGVIPETIDHINGIRHDNRLINLRPCTRSENNYNARVRSDNTSGVKGVHWNKKVNKWVAKIYVNKETVSLGYHFGLFEACCAIFSARNKLHGDFAKNR